MIEQLELLLKTKDAQKQQIQMQLTESKQDNFSQQKSPVKVPIRHKPNSPERMVSQASKANQPLFSDGPQESGSEHTAERIEFKVERKSYEP